MYDLFFRKKTKKMKKGKQNKNKRKETCQNNSLFERGYNKHLKVQMMIVRRILCYPQRSD
jgi:hypothetical protein